MAVVYAALRADDEYRKRVAIKIVRPGFDSEEILRRFRNERQTLATLDHPNIVKLLDGGSTEQGLPYLVMEYIEGTPIDQHCDSHRLSISERLRLFRTVCAAVHYAHQNLVIHRDLKPSNIVVTADGTPKLLDFGIAKLLNPEGGAQTLQLTLPQLRAMTPDYASPEQIRGQPLTTSTDIYSLGVVLYELLTGRLPYDLERRSSLEMEQIVSELEPEKPSAAVTRVEAIAITDGGVFDPFLPRPISHAREGHSEKLRRRLRGDLDNIVLMTLRKEPQRRYASAEQLSEDVRRHLEGLPVMAGTPTLRYRAAKFIRRHKAAAAAAAAVAVALVVGIVVTTHEAQVAQRRFQDVRHLANALLFELDDAVKDLPGSTPARKLIVQKALQYLDGLAAEAAGDRSLQADLAEAYLKVGEVQHSPYRASLGDAAGALESYRRALAVAALIGRGQRDDQAARRYAARAEQDIAGVLLVTGYAGPAADTVRRAIALFQAMSAAQSGDTGATVHLADSYNLLGDALGNESMIGNLRDPGGALDNYRKALAIYQQLATSHPNNLRMQSGLAVAHAKVGDVEKHRGNAAGALESYGKAVAIYEALSAAEPNNAQFTRNLGAVVDRLGDARSAAGDRPGALKDFRRSIALHKMLAAADPSNAAGQESLWLAYYHLAEWLSATDRHGAAESYRMALSVIEPLSAAQPANVQLRSKLAATLVALGAALEKVAERQEGQRLIARGTAVQRGLADTPKASPQELDDYAGTLLTCDRDFPCNAAAAVPYAKRAVAVTKEGDPETLETLAQAFFQAGDPALAVETEKRAVALVASSAARAPYEAKLAKFQKAAKRRH